MDQKFRQAFLDVVREQIVRDSEIKIEGIGVFRSEHRKQFQQQYKDGRVVMIPPKDTVKFVPEISNKNGY